jgi:hypothetical protein
MKNLFAKSQFRDASMDRCELRINFENARKRLQARAAKLLPDMNLNMKIQG